MPMNLSLGLGLGGIPVSEGVGVPAGYSLVTYNGELVTYNGKRVLTDGRALYVEV